MPKRSEPSRLAVGAATLVGVVALWYVLTQATHIIPSVYFATPADFTARAALSTPSQDSSWPASTLALAR